MAGDVDRMRTCVRDPARRPRRLLRVGRAARRPDAARAAGHRRRRRGAGGQLRGEGAAACARRWAAGRPGGCARGAVVVPPRMSAYTEASKAVFEVFERHDAAGRGALDRRGLPRRRRPAPRSSGTPARDRRDGCGSEVRERGRPADHRRRRPHEVPRQGGERRGQARRAARRAARRRARVPAPAAGRAAVGRRPGHRGASCTTAASRRSARWRGCPRPRSSSMLGPASGRHLHALAHNRDPRPVAGRRRRRRSIGSQRALGRSRRTAAELDAVLVALVDRVTRRHARGAAGSAARSCCACASTTSPAPPGRTRSPQADRRHARRSSPPRARLLRDAVPMIDERGLTLHRRRGRQPRRRRRRPARAALRRPRRTALDRRRPRRRARPLRRRRRSPGPCCSAATTASSMPMLPD